MLLFLYLFVYSIEWYNVQDLGILLEVSVDNIKGRRIQAIILHNHAAAANDLSWIAFFVDFTQTNPLPEFFLVSNLQNQMKGLK